MLVAFTPEEARFARLGGMLGDVLAEYGTPDWTDTGLVGFNNIVLGGVDTITMVFFDANERVRSYLLVYLEQPPALDDPAVIAGVVADVSPRDGECNDEPLDESGLGDVVYACHGDSLKGIYTAAELLEQELVWGEDAPGTVSRSIRPMTSSSKSPSALEPMALLSRGLLNRHPHRHPLRPLTETYPLVEDILTC